jgi:antitoxin ParD1/3/4
MKHLNCWNGSVDLKNLCQKIAVGTQQIARGQVTDGEIVFARLQEKINRIAESGA